MFNRAGNPAILLIAALILWTSPSGMGGQALKPANVPVPTSRAASLLKQGEAAYKSGHLDLAQHLLVEAIRLAPQSAPAHALLGLTLARRKDFKDALFNLRQAHELDPANADYAYDYAVLLLQHRQFGAAIPILEDLHQRSPQSTDVLVNLVRADIGAANFKSLSNLVSALSSADYHNPTLLKSLAGILAAAKQTAIQEKLWQATIRNDPTEPLAYAALAETWTACGEANKALALLDGAPAAARGPVYLYARGKTLMALRKYQEAGESFREITRQVPENDRAWQQMIWAEVLANHLRKAEAAAEEAGQKFPEATEFKYQKAVINYMLGRTTTAIDALTPVIQKNDAKDSRPVLLMAVLQSQAGNYQEAAQYFDRLARGETGCNALASYFYGSTLLRMHRPDDAVTQLQAAMQCHSHFALAEYRLGQALSLGGKANQALAALQQAIRDDPTLAEPFYALAQLRRRMGDVAGAQAALARFNGLHQHVKNSDRNLFRSGLH